MVLLLQPAHISFRRLTAYRLRTLGDNVSRSAFVSIRSHHRRLYEPGGRVWYNNMERLELVAEGN